MTVEDEELRLRQRLRQASLGAQLQQVGARILEWTEGIVVIGGLIVIVATKIPWIQGSLAKIGITATDQTAQVLTTLVLAAIFLQVRGLAKSAAQSRSGTLHLASPMEVYPILLKHARGIKRKNEKRIDVLGMTLYTAWPSINFWLSNPEFRGWTIRMSAVGGATDETAAFMPDGWVDEARRFLDQVAMASGNSALRQNNISIEAYGYDFVPVVHGYRLGNGDLFYSILMWGEDGRISRERYTYEFVPASDESSSADAIREIFDSWFRRSCAVRWDPATSKTPHQGRIG